MRKNLEWTLAKQSLSFILSFIYSYSLSAMFTYYVPHAMINSGEKVIFWRDTFFLSFSFFFSFSPYPLLPFQGLDSVTGDLYHEIPPQYFKIIFVFETMSHKVTKLPSLYLNLKSSCLDIHIL